MSNSIIQTEHGRYYFITIQNEALSIREIIGHKLTDDSDELEPIILNPATLKAEVYSSDKEFDSLTEPDDYLFYDAGLNELDGFPFMEVLQTLDSESQSLLLEKCYELNSHYHRLNHQIRDLPDAIKRNEDN